MVSSSFDTAAHEAEKAISGTIHEMEHISDEAAGGSQSDADKEMERSIRKAEHVAKEVLKVTEEVTRSAFSGGSWGPDTGAKEHIIGEE